jgi:transposase
MIELNLTEQEIQDLTEAIDDPSHSEKTKIKLLISRMRHEGAKTGFISMCLNLHGNTVTNDLNEFKTGNIPVILEGRYYKPTSLLDLFLKCIRCSFHASPVAGAKQAVENIEKLTGIRLSEIQSRRFIKSLGLKLRKTASIPGKCDHQLQFHCYTREMLPKLEEARLGQRKVLF